MDSAIWCRFSPEDRIIRRTLAVFLALGEVLKLVLCALEAKQADSGKHAKPRRPAAIISIPETAGVKGSANRLKEQVPLGEKEIDMELVRRVQRGEKAAFDTLVLKYQHKIANLVSRYVHDSHEAQDVTQEAFIKAYRGLTNFRGDSAFYTWLYRIAINTAKNYLVTMGRKVTDTGVDAQDAEQYEGGGALREYASPERQMLTDEIADVVRKSIEELPEDLQVAIKLREFEGMSYEEIAGVMECPIGTIRSRIFRAREAIDNNLAPLLS